jgi:hypothetical protein
VSRSLGRHIQIRARHRLERGGPGRVPMAGANGEGRTVCAMKSSVRY